MGSGGVWLILKGKLASCPPRIIIVCEFLLKVLSSAGLPVWHASLTLAAPRHKPSLCALQGSFRSPEQYGSSIGTVQFYNSFCTCVCGKEIEEQFSGILESDCWISCLTFLNFSFSI